MSIEEKRKIIISGVDNRYFVTVLHEDNFRITMTLTDSLGIAERLVDHRSEYRT